MNNRKLPETLIKYYECNRNNCDALINSYLWASSPSDFNDFFDFSIFTLEKKAFSRDWLVNTTDTKFHSLWTDNEDNNRYQYYSIYLRFLGIICLNEFEFENQDLLWGYYSKQCGFAIEFNTFKLKESLGKSPLRVNYKELNDFKLFRVDDNTEFTKILTEWGCQKKAIWNRETEWRFIFDDLIVDPITFQTKPETKEKVYDPESIEAIYLGSRFFEKERFINTQNNTFVFFKNTKNKSQSKLLSFLSLPSKLRIKHMFPKDDCLQLYPRECKIRKLDNTRFKIEYVE